MRLSPWGAHGSFHGNTISDRSNRPAAFVDAPVGSKLGSVLEMARERLSIQNKLSSMTGLSLSFVLLISPHPHTSHLLTLRECILSCALSLSRTPLISPLPSFPPLVSLFRSLWHCRGNLILDCLEFPRIPFGVAPSPTQRQTSAVGAKSSKHLLIIPPRSFLHNWTCLFQT